MSQETFRILGIINARGSYLSEGRGRNKHVMAVNLDIQNVSDQGEHISSPQVFPTFPQPSKHRPPFFPSFEKKDKGLDHPDVIHSRRRHEIEQSILLHSAFEFNRSQRQTTLSHMLHTHHRNHVVLVMMVNLGFTEIFHNWVRSCDEYGIDPRPWALIFALDAESADFVEQLGFSVYSDQISYGVQPKEAAQVFGDKSFVRLMFAKTAIVQDVLSLGYHVLFQDADMVWKRDPFEYLCHPSRERFDAQFMYDGPNPWYEPLHANSGFFFLRNTHESTMFWTMVFHSYDKMLHYGQQQKVVNIVLLSRYFRGLKLDMLPEEGFANGHLFCEDEPSKLSQDPYVIHCSWTKNKEHKIKKYQKADLWYLTTCLEHPHIVCD